MRQTTTLAHDRCAPLPSLLPCRLLSVAYPSPLRCGRSGNGGMAPAYLNALEVFTLQALDFG